MIKVVKEHIVSYSIIVISMPMIIVMLLSLLSYVEAVQLHTIEGLNLTRELFPLVGQTFLKMIFYDKNAMIVEAEICGIVMASH